MAKLVKQPGGVAARVEQLIKPTIEALGLRLWDVRFEKEGPTWYLKIFIDRDGPMDTDTCEAASRAIDPILDEADPISQSYCLEVGSPGLGRRLSRPEHFEAMQGGKVRAGLYRAGADGAKEVVGALGAFDGTAVHIETPGGERVLPMEEVAWVKLCDDEDLF